MKLAWTLLLLALCPALFAQNFREEVVSTHLLERMANQPDDMHSFYIILKDRVDAVALNHSLRESKASLDRRAKEVIGTLQAKAAATQGPIVQFLKENPGVDQSSVHSYWIANLVYAKATASAIAELSRREDIEYLGWNGPLAKTAHEEVFTMSSGIMPNGKEPGLAAIKAPALWAMGYSGYGRVAFTNDTGVDPSHPALAAQFRGFYTDPEISWYEFFGPNTTPYDCDDHGTHVTGTILGLDRISNDTIGVAFNAKWTGASTIGCGNSGNNEDNIGALQWAIDPDDNPNTTEDMPDAINNSWYDPWVEEECTSAYVDVLNALDAMGVAVIFSAGNEGPDDETISPPHNINTDLVNSFTIGALNGNSSSLLIADFSSRGPSICGGEGQLLIKPEVSAPGVSVRSSVTGNGYSNFSGTSMAAPHTTGAVLLLKEAFPYLPGYEIKLALYNSCTDLGVPGEDNIYGMGIINVEAAFNYLVSLGHVPVPPAPNSTDALVIRVESPEYNCDLTVNGRVLVKNDGLTTISEMELEVELDGITTPLAWSGTLEPGDIETIDLPTLSSSEGSKDLAVEIKKVNGEADDRLLNNRFVLGIKVEDRLPLEAAVELGADMENCEGSVVALRAQYDGPGTASYKWYDAPSDGNLLGEGPVFLAGPLFGDTTFYAQAVYADRVGLESIEEGPSQLDPEPEQEGLIFDAYVPFKIKSVVMYTETAGPRFVKLLDSDGETLVTKTLLVNGVGETRVTLNLNVPAGEDMELVLDYGLPLLYNTSGADFPYEVKDVLKIRRSNGPNGLQRWYYFYDWQIEYDEICGRTAVDVDIAGTGEAPAADFSASSDTLMLEGGSAAVDFTDLSVGADSWFWNFGDGATSTDQNPSYSYTLPGLYTVSLSAAGADGCASSAFRNILVTEMVSATFEPAHDQGLRVFPNPAQQWLEVSWEGEARELRVFDAIGRPLRLLQVEGNQARVMLDGLSNGLYFVSVDGRTAKFQIMR